MDNLLTINDLTIKFGSFAAVENLSFDVKKGEAIGIVGESGSGKTSVALAILGLLDPSASVSGEILFQEKNLLDLPENERRRLLGSSLGLVCQEPMSALNPVIRCGEQVAESLIFHKKLSKNEAERATLDLFRSVRLNEAERIFRSFPHQISGGQKQRVMIAIALAAEPALILFDEPTTALDFKTKMALLDLLLELKKRLGTTLIFISHDQKSVAKLADRVLLMANGRTQKIGPPSEVLSINSIKRSIKNEKNGLANFEKTSVENAEPPILKIENLTLKFPQPRRHFFETKTWKTVFENVLFSIQKGETWGIVGESGRGKTSLGRVLAGLLEATSGRIFFDGRPLAAQPDRWKKIQLIFQDSHEALNPRLSVASILSEPLERLAVPKKDWPSRISEILKKVDLSDELAARFPHELSGGQRQRVNIARALLAEPSVLICDEITASLDIEHQASLLILLNDLQKTLDLTVLLISHDLEIVEEFCDRVLDLD